LLSKLQVILAMLSTVSIILFVVWLGFVGRVIAAVLSQLTVLVYVISLGRWEWDGVFRLNLQVIWQLVKVGVPITISSVVIGLLTTIDRLIVIRYLGETQLGYFGLALLLTSIVSLIPGMASQVLYPRITYRYGESGNNIYALQDYVLTPPVLLSCLLPVLVGPLYLMFPIVIETFLPVYAPGILTSRIMLLGIFFFSIVGVTDYFLVTIGKLKQYVLLGVLALALNIALDLLFIRMGLGIEGVALGGTLITYFCYAVATIGYALSHYTNSVGDWIRFFAKLFIPFGYMLVLLFGVEWLVNFTEQHGVIWTFLTVGGQLFLFGLGCLPLVYMASRELKVEFSLAQLAKLFLSLFLVGTRRQNEGK
jgi:O-antigen/teichoic acid export membrane protein